LGKIPTFNSERQVRVEVAKPQQQEGRRKEKEKKGREEK
jgi:hypothetical protein